MTSPYKCALLHPLHPAPQSPDRIRAGQGAAEVFICHMSVKLGGRDTLVAQELLHLADINAGLDQGRGGGVAEHMRRDPALDPGADGQFAKAGPERLRRQRPAVPI